MKKRKSVRKFIPLIIALLAVVALSSIGYLIYSFRGNYIDYNQIDTASEDVSSAIAKESNIIVVDGVVLGASKHGNWVSADRFYNENIDKTEHEVNVYSQTSIYGTYKTAEIKKHGKKLIYTTVAKNTLPTEYLAISSNIDKNMAYLKEQEATEEDLKYVKEALSGYRILNTSINITEVYTAKIKNNGDKIICVTAKKSGMLGVYSAVVYVTNNQAFLVKFASVKDTDNANRWPLYSLKYIHDLNGDGVSELILEELTESEVRYTVQELRGNEFYQVLYVSIPL